MRKMTYRATTTILGALALGVALASCSSTGSSDDGGGDAAQVFSLSTGDSCFDITSVAAGSSDGCDLGVADTVANNGLVGASIPFNYDMTAVTISVGTDGSLGGGPILNNMATLVRDGDTTDGACMWHEHVDSMVTVTGTNAFTISASRTQSMFSAGCTTPPPPTGGMCTSTWTWTMTKSTTKSPTSTPPCT
jgi:hypothetical protein